ncbi:hypothetical protein U2F58_06870 [Lactobacillus johnsonii]|uniref:hypothetical protein n=1 Tax=Lactobacillus johnsonii TaxID=33959 RepID=UPI00117A97BD|nr:hypothetical protein [Lactobacillus johnsonii]
MAMTDVNNGEPYFLKVDISKAGQSSASINDYIKMRVADNGKILPVQWYDQGRVMNVNGMIPFMEGAVGQWHTDDDDNIVMAPDADYRDWQGSVANTRDGGWADYILTDQMFTQKGIFYGKIGLMDGNGRRLTSIDIWFKVLGNDVMFGLTQKYYSDRVEKLIRQIEDKTDQVIKDAREAYTKQIRASQDALMIQNTQMDRIRAEQNIIGTQAIGLQQQIDANDIVRKADFKSGINAETNARINGDNVLATRLDNVLQAETSKDVNSAPEIQDARVGSILVKSKKYESLGTSIRNQFEIVYNYLTKNGKSIPMQYWDIQNGQLKDKIETLFQKSQFLYQTSDEPFLDESGTQILDNDGNDIFVNDFVMKTDTTLTDPNEPANALATGKKIDEIKLASLDISGGDMLLSQPPSKHIEFTPEKGEDIGPVIKATNTSGYDAKMVESPSIIWDDASNQYIMVYTAYDQNNIGSIGYAYSTDLINWEKQGQLLTSSGKKENGDKNGCTGPCLLKYDGVYYLFYLGLNATGYEGGPINLCLATSTDLSNWTYKGIIISPDPSIPWIAKNIFHPCIMKIGTNWIIFFNANGTIDGQDAERVGFAVSKKIDGPYIVNPDRISKFAEDQGNHSGIQCGDPAVFKINDLYYMFYFDTSHNNEVVDRYAWTTPAEFPRGWRYGGPIIKNDKDYKKGLAHKPFVIIKDNILYHYYTAEGTEGRCIALQKFDLTKEN